MGERILESIQKEIQESPEYKENFEKLVQKRVAAIREEGGNSSGKPLTEEEIKQHETEIRGNLERKTI